jgi:ABC-type lipoprotein release transport system permease subunit
MMVFAMVIFILASFQMVTSGLTRTAKSALRNTPEITIQKMIAGRQESMPVEYIDRLEEIFGIREIIPRVWGYYFDEVNSANYTIIGMDTDIERLGKTLNLTLDSGRFPDKTGKGEVVVGNSVFEIKELADRPVFSLFRPDMTLKPLKLTGLFKKQTDILTNDLLFMNIKDARNLFLIPENKITDLCIYISNPAEVENIARKIAKLLPDTRVLTRLQIQKTYQVIFGWRSGFGSICLLSALAAFVILAWNKASGLTPEERKEIGILKIIGWQTNDILIIKSWESSLVSGFAFITGCISAYIHVVFYQAIMFRPVLIGWSVIKPHFQLVPEISLATFILIFAFTVIPYLTATVIPAWRCAIIPAEEALKS